MTMERQEILDRLDAIKKQALGTYNGSIIKLVEMQCSLIADLTDYVDIVQFHDSNEEPDDACVSVPEVPEGQPDLPTDNQLPKADVSKPTRKKARKANKTTTDKAKTATK